MPEEQTTQSGSTSETQSEQDSKVETTTQATSETLGTTTAQAQTSATDDISREIERLKASLKRANAEAKEHREKATELAQFKEQKEAESLSAQEKQALAQQKLEKQLAEHQSQNSTLLQQLQEARIHNEVLRQSSRLNIIDLDAATKLIDASRIDYDEAGNPTNIDTLLKELVKARPWLAGKAQSQQTSGGATNPPRSQTSLPLEMTREQAQNIMKAGRDEFNKLSPDEQRRVRKALNPGLFRN